MDLNHFLEYPGSKSLQHIWKMTQKPNQPTVHELFTFTLSPGYSARQHLLVSLTASYVVSKQ